MALTPDQVTALDEFEAQLTATVDRSRRALDQERRFLQSVQSSFGETAATQRMDRVLLLRARSAVNALVGGA